MESAAASSITPIRSWELTGRRASSASGTMSQESYIYAGTRGLHLCTAFFIPDKEAVRSNIALYRKTLTENGFDPSTRDVAGVFPMYCGESKAESLRYGGECTLTISSFFGALERGVPLTASGGFGDRGIEYYDEKQLVLIGEPDALIERIRWARDYYDTNYLLFEVAQGGASHRATVDTLRRFAKHVMPAFKEG